MEGFLEPKKNSKDENLKDENYLKKKRNLENYLQNGIGNVFLESKRENLKNDTWPISCMPKMAMQNGNKQWWAYELE